MAPKPYKFTGFGDIHDTKRINLEGLVTSTKAYKFMRFGDIRGPKAYKFT